VADHSHRTPARRDRQKLKQFCKVPKIRRAERVGNLQQDRGIPAARGAKNLAGAVD
jgi:hypothetical protein